MQRHIEKPVKHLRRSFPQKQSTAFSRYLFPQKTPSQTFDLVQNTPLQLREHSVLKQPMDNDFQNFGLAAINLAGKK